MQYCIAMLGCWCSFSKMFSVPLVCRNFDYPLPSSCFLQTKVDITSASGSTKLHLYHCFLQFTSLVCFFASVSSKTIFLKNGFHVLALVVYAKQFTTTYSASHFTGSDFPSFNTYIWTSQFKGWHICIEWESIHEETQLQSKVFSMFWRLNTIASIVFIFVLDTCYRL